MAEQVDDDLRQAAKAAAAAAAVGAAAGVARAIASRARDASNRHGDEPEDEQPQDEQPEDEQPDDEQQEQSAAPEPEDVQEDEQPEEEPQSEPEREPARGERSGRLHQLTDTARQLLEELSGAEVETVSALGRTDGGWRVTLEAVELRRIPDSTDVLATYEVELDGDGDLVRYERRRRYARSQSDHGEDA
jgi:type IV secretory pathway VirB10-like protein